ncbi:hypothetical protein LINGRAHAP2_LOCUS16319 [Linum grandiflorum]
MSQRVTVGVSRRLVFSRRFTGATWLCKISVFISTHTVDSNIMNHRLSGWLRMMEFTKITLMTLLHGTLKGHK